MGLGPNFYNSFVIQMIPQWLQNSSRWIPHCNMTVRLKTIFSHSNRKLRHIKIGLRGG